MKLTTLIILIAFMQVSAKTYSQITLHVNNKPLTEVLESVKKQTGYVFFYEGHLLDNINVSVDVNNVPLKDAIDKCLKDLPLSYNVVKKNVVITPKVKAAPEPPKTTTAAPITISGKITDTLGTPLIGATVANKTTGKAVVTDDKGEFSINANVGDDLSVSFIGYKPLNFQFTPGTGYLNIQLHSEIGKLKEVVVNTGYQNIPQERATGAFSQIDNQILNRTVSTGILDRIDGNATGFYKSNSSSLPLSTNPQARSLGVTIRGQSTLNTNVGTDPLIVLDNFPYQGDINNINPNDIESVSILKDAAAASIWGAKAGNGVIVLTSKKGRFNSRMQVDFTSNTTIIGKPDIYKDHNYLDASDYIDIEKTLFNNGYYDSSIADTYNYPALTPVIDILSKQRDGLITQADANSQIDALRRNDLRSEAAKYLFKKGINQQYSTGIRGGDNNLNYSLRVGYDKNQSNTVGVSDNRITINSNSTYTPIKNLEITTTINYSQAKSTANSGGVGYSSFYPYAKLADANGNYLAIAHGYRSSYIDSVEKLGFVDWNYRPLQELQNNDNTTKNTELLLKASAKYRFTPFLSFNLDYQNEYQHILGRNYENQNTYAVRNLINEFTQYNPSTGSLTYIFPKGGILDLNTVDWNSYDWRGMLSFNKNIGKDGYLSAIAGAELYQLVTTGYDRTSYGYNDEFGTSTNYLDYLDYFPTNPNNYNALPGISGDIQGAARRNISYYSNAAYTYKNRYTVSISGRKDGANIFGAKTNDKFKPLWSAGFSWDVSKESFYKSEILSDLKLRATYGYNGNVYNGAAYATGIFSTGGYNKAPAIANITPPNPNLKWENVKTVNIGLDFAFKKNIIYGSLDIYDKKGLDLVEPINLAPSTGFSTFNGNAASTDTKGIELMLTAKIIDQKFKWQTTVIGNYLNNKVSKYDQPLTAESITSSGGQITTVGKPIYSIFAYKWAGLDAANGNPQGYLNGKISEDYTGIYNNYKPDSLKYFGSATSTKWGTFRNDFSYQGISLSFTIGFKFGYYFRKPSVSTNLQDFVNGTVNDDFVKRWQKPGDEKTTNVPSIIYPSDNLRNIFYTYSETLVQKGDNIRFQDIRLSYDLNQIIHHSPFSSFQIYSYVNNLGVIWRANKYDIDPDNYTGYPNPFTISFGLQATLK